MSDLPELDRAPEAACELPAYLLALEPEVFDRVWVAVIVDHALERPASTANLAAALVAVRDGYRHMLGRRGHRTPRRASSPERPNARPCARYLGARQHALLGKVYGLAPRTGDAVEVRRHFPHIDDRRTLRRLCGWAPGIEWRAEQDPVIVRVRPAHDEIRALLSRPPRRTSR